MNGLIWNLFGRMLMDEAVDGGAGGGGAVADAGAAQPGAEGAGSGSGGLLSGFGGEEVSAPGGDGEGMPDGDGGRDAGGEGAVLAYDPENPEAMEAWRRGVGLTGEMGEDYVPVAPEGLPDGVWDAEAVMVMAAEAHRLGLPQKQFAALAGVFAAKQAEAVEAAESARKEAGLAEFNALKQEWGDGFGGRLAAANRTLESLGVKVSEGLAQSVEFARVVDAVARALGESPRVGGKQAGGDPQAAMDDILRNPKNPLHKAFLDPGHPRHKEAHDVYNGFFRSAHGGAAGL